MMRWDSCMETGNYILRLSDKPIPKTAGELLINLIEFEPIYSVLYFGPWDQKSLCSSNTIFRN